MIDILKILYTVGMLGLAIYALHALTLIALYLIHRRTPIPDAPRLRDAELPFVTVQIPLRNERYVAQQVIRAVAAFDWPRDRLEIQILDDSDDDTTEIVRREAASLRQAGHTAVVIHRSHPTGYKAGALAEGLRRARGAFVALFDADFCPPPDFLRRTVPHLVADPKLGMVQARWIHANTHESLVTRVQALALDAHFSVEHLARNHAGLLMNFNGAAGVWRRQTIVDAGGWQSDTVTEDLDLSYRAQLAQWRVRYLPDVVASAELPSLVTSFKTQQARWAKGASQCLRKLAGPVVRSPHLSPIQKVMALLHLSGYMNQPFLLLMILLTLPIVLVNPVFPGFVGWLGGLASIPVLLYVFGQMHFYRDWPRRILVYPALMLLWVGLSWSITLAVIDGLTSWGGPFVRTPKFRAHARSDRRRTANYRPRIHATWIGELIIGLYATVALALAINLQHEHLLPLTLIYVLGEAAILGTTLMQDILDHG